MEENTIIFLLDVQLILSFASFEYCVPSHYSISGKHQWFIVGLLCARVVLGDLGI